MHENFFEEARRVAENATCGRARCGSIVVSKNGEIIGKGYNAPPCNDESQRMCHVDLNKGIKQNNDKTCCVHAEWNAILDALRFKQEEVNDSTLYFMRVDDDGNVTEAGNPYCTVCSRLALQSGIKTFGLWNDGPDMIDTKLYNLKSYSFYR